jgi:hypothetical protein
VNEAYLKKRLCDETRKLIPGVVIFRHEDKFSGGIPDCSFTWGGRTVWVEVKYRRKGTAGLLTELQRLTISRLIRQGRALVVTYVERPDHSLVIQVDRPTGREDEVTSHFVDCGANFNHVGVAGIILEELKR